MNDILNFAENTWAALMRTIMKYPDIYYPTILNTIEIPVWLLHYAQAIRYLAVPLEEYSVAFRIKMCTHIVYDVDPDELVSNFEMILANERINRETRKLESESINWICPPPKSYFGC